MVETVGVEFFCYHRDRPGSVTLREELLEQHWSYMDQDQAEMIARGPTLAADAPAGSVHIVGLPDPAAARAFAAARLSRGRAASASRAARRPRPPPGCGCGRPPRW